MIVIADTSVLSALAEIDHAGLLPELMKSVVITDTVYAECTHSRSPPPTRQLVLTATWIRRVPDPSQLLPEAAALDPGEASAISYACQQAGPTLLLVDDAAARKLCQALQLSITGTVGILFKASRLGIIDFDSAVGHLRRTTFRISNAVIDELNQRLSGT